MQGTHEWRTMFKGKRVTILGLGLLGRGVNVAKFLVECGATYDHRFENKRSIAPSLRALKI